MHVRRFAQGVQLGLKLRSLEPLGHVRHEPQLGNRLDVQIEWIAKEPTHRTVGADVFPAIQQRMQRIQSDERGAHLSTPPDELLEIGEVADAPVPFAAHRIQIRNEAERPPLAEQGPGHDASRRHDDEQLLTKPLASFAREGKPAAGPRAHFARRAAPLRLELHDPARAGARRRRQPQREMPHGGVVLNLDDTHRRNELVPRLGAERAQRGFDRGVARCVDAHRRQHGDHRLRRRLTTLGARLIHVSRYDADGIREALERRAPGAGAHSSGTRITAPSGGRVSETDCG